MPNIPTKGEIPETDDENKTWLRIRPIIEKLVSYVEVSNYNKHVQDLTEDEATKVDCVST